MTDGSRLCCGRGNFFGGSREALLQRWYGQTDEIDLFWIYGFSGLKKDFRIAEIYMYWCF
jgi:hypothetical protein